MKGPPPLPKKRKPLRWLDVVVYGIILLLLLSVLNPSISPSPGQSYPSASRNVAMQNAHSIGLAMFQYAHERDGKYPDGKTSTEVFQKLMDAGDLSNPEIFYLPMQGKTRCLTSCDQKVLLKPENVCYDVTSGVDANSSEDVPLVFSTGYQITYLAGASAVPLHPRIQPTFREKMYAWWIGQDLRPCAGICYSGLNAVSFMVEEDGTIPDFIPKTFDAHGKVFKQLTP